MHYSTNIRVLTHAMSNPALLDEESGLDFIDVSSMDDQEDGATGGYSGPPPQPAQQPLRMVSIHLQPQGFVDCCGFLSADMVSDPNFLSGAH